MSNMRSFRSYKWPGLVIEIDLETLEVTWEFNMPEARGRVTMAPCGYGPVLQVPGYGGSPVGSGGDVAMVDLYPRSDAAPQDRPRQPALVIWTGEKDTIHLPEFGSPAGEAILRRDPIDLEDGIRIDLAPSEEAQDDAAAC